MKTRMIFAAAAAALAAIALPAQAALAGAAHPAAPASAAAQPWPVTITIQTVPPLAGVRFLLDGTVLITGKSGKVTHTGQHNFSRHTLRLAHPRIARRDVRYTFARWAGQRDPNQAFRPLVRGLPMRADYTVTASFITWCPVTPTFTDQHGDLLDPARIRMVSVRGDTGRSATLSPDGTSWLPCGLPVFRGSRLSSKPVQYSVESVIISGANAVHAGTQRFLPRTTPHPVITGYFHDLTITAHDALFGGGAGTQARVTLPDHTVTTVALGPGHAATLHGLPQGTYLVDVRAGGAMVSVLTVRLSRDQRVNATAISHADLLTIGGGLLAAIAGLPLLSGSRRRRVLGLLRRGRGRAVPA